LSSCEVLGGSGLLVVFPIPGAVDPLLVGTISTYCWTAEDFGFGGGADADAAGAATKAATPTKRAMSRLFAVVVRFTAKAVP
jgi:hypothetical protein